MKVRLLKFFTILAMAVVLFAMVSCAEEPAPATPDAQIPSEDGGSAKNFDASDAQTVQKVFPVKADHNTAHVKNDVSDHTRIFPFVIFRQITRMMALVMVRMAERAAPEPTLLRTILV